MLLEKWSKGKLVARQPSLPTMLQPLRIVIDPSTTHPAAMVGSLLMEGGAMGPGEELRRTRIEISGPDPSVGNFLAGHRQTIVGIPPTPYQLQHLTQLAEQGMQQGVGVTEEGLKWAGWPVDSGSQFAQNEPKHPQPFTTALLPQQLINLPKLPNQFSPVVTDPNNTHCKLHSTRSGPGASSDAVRPNAINPASRLADTPNLAQQASYIHPPPILYASPPTMAAGQFVNPLPVIPAVVVPPLQTQLHHGCSVVVSNAVTNGNPVRGQSNMEAPESIYSVLGLPLPKGLLQPLHSKVCV